MKEPEPYLNARQAAVYLGYEPGDGPCRTDPAMRAFYARVARLGIRKHQLGRSLRFRRLDLDAALGPSGDDLGRRLQEMEQLARAHARGGRPDDEPGSRMDVMAHLARAHARGQG